MIKYKTFYTEKETFGLLYEANFHTEFSKILNFIFYLRKLFIKLI